MCTHFLERACQVGVGETATATATTEGTTATSSVSSTLSGAAKNLKLSEHTIIGITVAGAVVLITMLVVALSLAIEMPPQETLENRPINSRISMRRRISEPSLNSSRSRIDSRRVGLHAAENFEYELPSRGY